MSTSLFMTCLIPHRGGSRACATDGGMGSFPDTPSVDRQTAAAMTDTTEHEKLDEREKQMTPSD